MMNGYFYSWSNGVCVFAMVLCMESLGVAADKSEAESLRALSRTHQMAVKSEQVGRGIARAIIGMDTQFQAEPVVRKHVRIYVALASVRLGDNEAARRICEEIVKDKADINAPDAAAILRHLALGEAAQDDSATWMGRVFRAAEELAAFYPSGFYADQMLWAAGSERYQQSVEQRRKAGETVLGSPEIPIPRRDLFPLLEAASLYAGMSMHDRSIATFRVGIGFLPADEWISPRAQGYWLGMGHAYRAMGNWDQALGCYLKAVASGESAKEIGEVIAEMKASAIAKKPAPEWAPKPDAAMLMKIAELLKGTQLFVEAGEALRVAEAIQPGIGAEVKRSLEVAERACISSLISAYGEGGLFRGIPVTHAHLKTLSP